MTAQSEAEKLLALAAKVEALTGIDNALDVLIEIALFEPDSEFDQVRSNHAGTKVIYTRPDGSEQTFWADDWTMNADATVETLRARAALATENPHD